jgi:hypothetical protein
MMKLLPKELKVKVVTVCSNYVCYLRSELRQCARFFALNRERQDGSGRSTLSNAFFSRRTRIPSVYGRAKVGAVAALIDGVRGWRNTWAIVSFLLLLLFLFHFRPLHMEHRRRV